MRFGQEVSRPGDGAHPCEATSKHACASSVHPCINPIHDAINAIIWLRNGEIDISD
ncbi:hypothetical protein C7S13_5813 [Burkholderia cepacia]|nr:hypothetical protein [Burkholderia cepacia]